MAGLFFAKMKRHLVFFILCFSASSISAQFKVRLSLKISSPNHSSDSIFLAGNFNNWNPKDANYQLIKDNGSYFIEIKNVSAGAYEFKVTRGDWLTVETNSDGTSIDNRTVHIKSDTTLELTIKGWSDDFAKPAKLHTASAHVTIMDTAFEIPGLNRTRKIWLYLPEGYSKGKKRYPVLYMHDGQDIFDDYTAAFGEWGVDEWMDSLIASGQPPCIVVGIENGYKRMNEYNPFDNEKFGEGEGRQYSDFIINSLKPYVDKHYKTLTGKENTAIAGSSMGGLISYYAILQYPEIFGKAGIFSPAFWIAAGIGDFTDSTAKSASGKFFFYAGSEEGEQYVEDMKRLQEKLGINSSAMVYSVIDSTGKHNEAAWRKWFGEFYCWIMASGFNNVTKIGD